MIEIAKPILTGSSIEYPVRINQIEYRFTLEIEGRQITPEIDGLVCMLAPIAILNCLPIKSEEPIDSVLYENLMKLPAIYKKYHHKHTSLMAHLTPEDIKLDLDIPICNRPRRQNCSVTSMSLGVDSLCTILQKADTIDTTIHIRGLDGPLEPFAEINLQYASRILDVPIQFIKTNFKSVMGKLPLKGTNYGVFTGDSIFVAAVYPLGASHIIFNGFGCEDSFPCLSGQHPEVNQYFQSAEFTSENVDMARVKKVKYLLDKKPQLLNVLKVCTNMLQPRQLAAKLDTNGIYYDAVVNCSNCGKCDKTLLYIWMLGQYHNASTFTHTHPDFLEYFERTYVNNPDYKKNRLLASSFYDILVEKVLAFYKTHKSLDTIEKEPITFAPP